MNHGPILLARRRAMKMTQDHLAGAAEVSRSTVQRAERGHVVSDENLRALLAVLGLSLSDLVPERPAPAAPPAPPPFGGRVPSVLWSELTLLNVLLMATLWLLVRPRWLDWGGDGPGGASRHFWMFLASMLFGLAACAVAGRILWRRGARPDADGISAFARIGIGRFGIPVPALRWSRDGRRVRTWPGGLLALGLASGLVFAGHYRGVVSLVYPAWPAIGFDSAYGSSGVWQLEPGSRLEAAGLKLGDQVLAVDGEPVLVPNDLNGAVRDAEGRTLDLTVARPKPRGPGGEVFVHALVHVPVEVGRVEGGCMAGVPCGGVGDTRGLFSPLRTVVPLGSQLRVFAREIGAIAAMVRDPDAREAFDLGGRHGRRFRLWLDAMNFRVAAPIGIVGTLLALWALIAIDQGLGGLARLWARIRAGERWRPARAGAGGGRPERAAA